MPVRRVYEKAVNDDSDTSDEHTPLFDSVRSRAKRFRSSFMPPVPLHIDDVQIPHEWRKTRNGRPFLSLQDNNWGILVFTTRNMVRVLQKCQSLFIDGTFRTAPQPYEQLVTVHGLYGGFVIPLVFCLLNGKTIGQYRQLIQHLKEIVRVTTGHRLRPTRVVSDFERSLLIAIETELPNCRTSGCYFHWTQSLWRNVQQRGLARPYRSNARLSKFIRLIMAIAFIPVLLVRQNFLLLRGRRRTRRLVRQYPQLDEWLDYVYETYIHNNSAFPPAMWNVHNRNVDTRTDNHVEGL